MSSFKRKLENIKKLKVLSSKLKNCLSIKIQLGFNMKNVNVPKEFQ